MNLLLMCSNVSFSRVFFAGLTLADCIKKLFRYVVSILGFVLYSIDEGNEVIALRFRILSPF